MLLYSPTNKKEENANSIVRLPTSIETHTFNQD